MRDGLRSSPLHILLCRKAPPQRQLFPKGEKIRRNPLQRNPQQKSHVHCRRLHSTRRRSRSTVVKRGQRRKQRIAGQLLASTTTPKQQPPPLPKKKVPPLQPKLRAPKTAAVVITLQPGAEEKGHTYGQILAVARAKINLSELGIEGVRFRRALTGAAVLLLAGSNREGCAHDLAKALKLVIDPAIARVSIPSKTAELLISGLDHSRVAHTMDGIEYLSSQLLRYERTGRR
ncbi:hypothetical protein ACJJTC_003920 [Scirpophaga incertulas]